MSGGERRNEPDRPSAMMLQAGAERAVNPWVSLVVSLLLAFIGCALLVDLGGIPRRIHERNRRILGKAKVERAKASFFSSFSFDRLIGAVFLAYACYGVPASLLSVL
ncbi:hypothetical protein ACXZ65_01885 [Streptomyces aculeolatus]